MSFYSLPRDYDSQFQAPEPEGMHGVMGSDPNRYESFVPSREPSVISPTAENLAWRKRLDDACKETR